MPKPSLAIQFGTPHWQALLVKCLICLAWGLFATPNFANSPDVGYRSGILGEGEAWQTEWHAYESGIPGPIVMVLGGVHGNEPAGARAALQIRHWTVEKGKLIVIPRANRIGLQANTRWIPEFRNDRKLRDLNRNFPRQNAPTTQTELAAALWEFTEKQKPDWFFDLHEGFDFHRLNPKSVGSSVITFPDETQLKSEAKGPRKTVMPKITEQLQGIQGQRMKTIKEIGQHAKKLSLLKVPVKK